MRNRLRLLTETSFVRYAATPETGYEVAQPNVGKQQSFEVALYLGDEPLDVVGESHYQEELWAIVGGRRRDLVREDVIAILLPQPDNPYDENAISIWVDLKLVGYLSRDDAALYREGLLRLIAENDNRPIALRAQIVGGGEIEDEDRPGYLGVFLAHDPVDFGLEPREALEAPRGLTYSQSVARRSSNAARMRAVQREQERAAAAAIRASEHARKAMERAQAWEKKERKRQYLESRQAEAEALNAELTGRVETLETLLQQTLDVDDYLDFDELKEQPALPPFRPEGLDRPEMKPFRHLPPPPSGVSKFVPGAKAKYEQAVEAAGADHRQKLKEYNLREKGRLSALAKAQTDHDAEVARIKAGTAAQHADVESFRAQFGAGDPAAIVEYFSLVLDRSSYPRVPEAASDGVRARVEAACRRV